MNKIIAFDNLRQPSNSGIVGETQKVRAIRPSADEHSSCKSANETLWQPANLEEVSLRARQSGERFRKLFQL
jgi:hypothetical protein